MGFSIKELFASAALISSSLAWVAPSNIPPHAYGYGAAKPTGTGASYKSFPTWSPSKLPPSAWNGNSTFGTLNHPPLGPYAPCPVPEGSMPWGGRTTTNTNPYDESTVPDTGITRYYSWTVTNQTLAPDGVSIPMLVANGQFPGPLIEANWGDWIEVEIINGLESEGTAMHWHGFLQTGTPWFDGVPGVGQCPIAPGSSLTYRFRAELYGTSWWHGHYSAQYINGLAGPIVVHGPKSSEYDIDLGPIMLSDWFHNYYLNLVEQVFHASEFGPILPPMANNMLIQGKSPYNCSATNLTCSPDAPAAEFKFKTGKKHLLRLINHSAEAIIFFSIDGYNVTVIANDFVPVVPYSTDLVTLAVGQRTDIVVEGGNDTTEAVWMRITEGPSGLGPTGDTGCSLNDGLHYETTAAIYYEDADTSIKPNTTTDISPSRYLFPLNCNNQALDLTVPEFVMPVLTPTTTLNFTMTGGNNATGEFVWWMNNITFYTDYNDPTLLEAKLGNDNFTRESAVYNMGNNTVLRIIMQSVGFPASHPMHIHGHNMQVLAEGLGTWDGTTIVNSANPQRRDTQLIQPAGYLVVQIELGNAGVWPFHCHIAWHISEGMNINILEDPSILEDDLVIPSSIAQTCRDWWTWTDHDFVNQIDSGL